MCGKKGMCVCGELQKLGASINMTGSAAAGTSEFRAG
jgi:hypothetical protein